MTSEDALWAVRRFLEVLADRHPLVVVIDDLHWAQPALLDLLEQVVALAREASILVVAVARPELLEQRPGWSGGRLNASTMLLEPLAAEESATLLEHLAGEAALPGDATDRITRTAEGNPLFLEELLAMLIEEGRLRRDGGRWVADDLAAATTPPTIQALLAARLDRLAGEERALLDRASVMGQAFDRAAVLALTPEPARAAADAHLLALVRKELLRPAQAPWAAATASSSATSSSGTPPTTRCPSRPGPSCTSATPPGWPRRMRPAAARSGRCSAGTWSGPTGS